MAYRFLQRSFELSQNPDLAK